jgi:hypothetical protein
MAHVAMGGTYSYDETSPKWLLKSVRTWDDGRCPLLNDDASITVADAGDVLRDPVAHGDHDGRHACDGRRGTPVADAPGVGRGRASPRPTVVGG